MTPTEKAARIIALCRELLALAEKRTPGDWRHYDSIVCEGPDEIHGKLGWQGTFACPNDAAYIAACAGSAESGWRATIAALEGLQRIAKTHFGGWEGDGGTIAEAEASIDDILAAWPDDLLE